MQSTAVCCKMWSELSDQKMDADIARTVPCLRAGGPKKMERKELSPNGKEERKGSSPAFPEEEEREGSSPPFLVDPEMFYDLLMEQQEQM